jgi:hypothetical protein
MARARRRETCSSHQYWTGCCSMAHLSHLFMFTGKYRRSLENFSYALEHSNTFTYDSVLIKQDLS